MLPELVTTRNTRLLPLAGSGSTAMTRSSPVLSARSMIASCVESAARSRIEHPADIVPPRDTDEAPVGARKMTVRIVENLADTGRHRLVEQDFRQIVDEDIAE